MNPPRLRVVTPVWAQRIDVDKQGNNLLVTGWGRIPDPFDAGEVTQKDISRIDIFQRFRRYVLRQLSEKETTKDAGVYQFADAATDEKLVEFVKEFGPVWGKVRSSKYEKDGTVTLTVAQSVDRLRNDQKEFAAVAKILQQVNRNSQCDPDVIAASMFEVPFLSGHAYALTGNAKYPEGPLDKESPALFWANRALCLVLNGFAPKLVPYKGEVFEMPEMNEEGIRTAIYWQLRRDYLAQREIGTCLHCGSHFAVFKRGTQGCSESCRRALRNQKYWDKSKATINAERREKHTGRK